MQLRVGLCALSLALGLVAGCGGSNKSATTDDSARDTKLIEVSLANGKVTPELLKVSVPTGTEVTIAATADVDEELHVHGLEKKAELKAGETTELTFVAEPPSVYEVEFEKSALPALDLEVTQ